MLLGASIVRLIFPTVPLFPREKTNLKKESILTSILVLVVKQRHHAKDLYTLRRATMATVMRPSISTFISINTV